MALIQTCVADGSSGSASPTWGASTTNANALIAVVSCSRANGAGSAPTITAPDVNWVEVKTDVANDAGGARVRTSIYVKANAASESGSKTWTCTTYMSSANIGVVMAEYSQVATSSPADQSAASPDNNSSSTTCSTGTTGTTTQADELLIACLNGGSSIGTPTNSFTLQAQTSGARNTALADRTVSSTGTYSTSATYSTGARNVGVIATFKLAAAAYSGGYEEACDMSAGPTRQVTVPRAY